MDMLVVPTTKNLINSFDQIKCFLFRLNNLFTGLPSASSLRFDAYISQLRLASKFEFTDNIETQLKVVSVFY